MKRYGWYLAYLAPALLLAAWVNRLIPAAVLLLLSGVDVLYFLVAAPLWCGAVNRDGTFCRNNSSGLLLGCWIREHKWQRLKMVVVRRRWRELYVRLRSNWLTVIATVNVLAGLGSMTIAGIALVVKR